MSDTGALSQVEQKLDLLATSRSFVLIVNTIMDMRNQDPLVVKTLGRLATSTKPLPRLRWSAAYALRAIHTKDALPYLAKLLDSENPELQALAVSGISSFANNLPVVTAEKVRTMEWMKPQGPPRYPMDGVKEHEAHGQLADPVERAKYVNFWKGWWSAVEPQVLQAIP